MKCIYCLFFLLFFVFARAEEPPAALHYINGLAYYRAGEALKARAEFQKTLQTEKEHAAALQMLKNLDKEIFKEDPRDPFNAVIKEYFENGLLFYRKNEKEKAVKEWEKALLVTPANKQLREFYEAAGPAPVKQETEAVNPELPVKKNGQGKTSEKKTEPQKSSTLNLRPDAGVKPENKKAADLYYEGLKAYKLGELKKAINIWEQVLLLDPGLTKARKNLENAKKQIVQGEQK